MRDRTWATTSRIPTADGPVWFKSSAPSHAFEAQLVGSLARGWPDLLPRVLACDPEPGWLLTADAGVSFEELGNPPELWLHERLRLFAPRFGELCEELAGFGLPPAVQHDDLHHKNAFVDGDCLRIIDWGDASLSHPFVSLVVTFRFLEEHNGLSPGDAWFARLRDAYLEPWGSGLVDAFELAERLGRFVHAFGWVSLLRLLPAEQRPVYEVPFGIVLRRALAALPAT